MFLSYFLSTHELSTIPLPDKIITNGKTQFCLLHQTYPKNMIVKGSAFRYSRLLEEIKIRKKVSSYKLQNKKNKKIILITPSIGIVEASELILKTIDAFKNMSEYLIFIKCHPYASFDKLSKYFAISLPENFIISDTPLYDLLTNADLLIYTSSTTAIEALCFGIPILHVISEYGIDLDQLENNPIIERANTPSEISKKAKILLNLNTKQLSIRQSQGYDTFSSIFSDIKESSVSLFTSLTKSKN